MPPNNNVKRKVFKIKMNVTPTSNKLRKLLTLFIARCLQFLGM